MVQEGQIRGGMEERSRRDREEDAGGKADKKKREVWRDREQVMVQEELQIEKREGCERSRKVRVQNELRGEHIRDRGCRRDL